MKKVILLLLFVLSVDSLHSKEKPSLSVRLLFPFSETITNEYEDNTIKVSFDVSEKALFVKIYNKTSNRINIEWENFRIDDSAIAFDTDRRLKMDEPKADEVVFPKSYSTHNNLIPKKAIEDSYIDGWWKIDKIGKMGEQFTKIIIPIRVNNANKDYVFQIGVACMVDGVRTKVNIPNQEKVDSICEGMKYEDVLSIIGYPIFFTQTGRTFTAHYFNGLSVEFQVALKIHAELLSHYWTPNTINIGLAGRKKTIVTKIDRSQMHNLSPEQYYRELYE